MFILRLLALFVILISLISFGTTATDRRTLQFTANLCPSNNISYTIHLIDAFPSVRIMGCTYSLSLKAGQCAYTSQYVRETEAGYVCFNQTSTPCVTISLPLDITGNYMCRGNLITEKIPLPPGNFLPLQEYEVSTSYIRIKAMIGMNCNGISLKQPRECSKEYQLDDFAWKSGCGILVSLLIMLLVIF